MEKILAISFVVVVTFMQSCTKEQTEILPYEGKVLGTNIDCGEYEILISSDLEKIESIIGVSPVAATYIAAQLPEEFREVNIKVSFNCRVPEPGEVSPCTTFGPTLPWLVITAIKKEN